MSKRMIKVMLGSLILIMNLTACGMVDAENKDAALQNENNEVISLTVWGAKEDQALLNDLVEGFKQQYSNEADFDITLGIEDELDCKNIVLSNVNEAADVFTFFDDQLMALAAAGVLEPITYQEEIIERNLEGAVKAATINDMVYAYPLTADNGYFMYYNSQYFSEEDVKSLDRMLEVAGQHDKKIAMDMSSGWYLYAFFGNTGLSLGLNDDYVTNYCTWNTADGAIKGTDIVEAMKKMAASKGFISTDDDGFIRGVEDGSIIAGINGTWNAVRVEEAWKEHYAATKLPTYSVANKQVQMSSFVGYKMVGVNAYSKNPEWAEKLAEYLSNEQNQFKRFKQNGQGPSNKQAAQSEEINQSIAIKALLQQSEFGDLQHVGGLYWGATTELGNRIAQNNLEGMTNQQLIDKIVNQITSNKVTE